MSFADRLCLMPRAHDAGRALEARAQCGWADGPVADLIAGTAGSSAYLAGLIGHEADWLEAALDDPEAAFGAILSAVPEYPPEALPAALRRAKRRTALLLALADLGGVWSLEEVTTRLTEFADAATHAALLASVGREARRGKLPGVEPDDPTCGGVYVLAMGKMGAFELNYSSDIDLICLFDETRFDPEDFHAARQGFVRAVRATCAMLSDRTSDGYVFRTDLRLRPDPSVTPVVLAAEAAERYYESLGRTWERAAYIKARPCAGDVGAGRTFLETLKPFIWRKHLDFVAIRDAQDMRLRIREHKGLTGPITLPGHNMKLGRGGIREIEFFTQTQQMIWGGRDTTLRLSGTVDGLGALSAAGRIPGDVADALADHYRAHRMIEHRIQMMNDAQTHDLPVGADGFAQLAALSGRDEADMRADIRDRLEDVHSRIERFFAPDGAAPRSEPVPLADHELTANWARYPALRSARAVEVFERIKPEILRRIAKAARPEDALTAFDGFLSGLPAGLQLFSLFEANPQLVDLLTDIVSTAPALASYLSRNAAVFDAVIGGDFFADWPGAPALTQDLADALDREADYERRLELARRWGKEWHFRIGVHLLRGLSGPEEAGAQYADLAQAMLAALWPVVTREFARRFGPEPGRGAVVLGMGSLGAGRLHARSDLDLILIYDAEGAEASDGPKSLATRVYYARLTQAFIAAITAPMAEGRLYEIDMRLRPSGNQGPVATSWDAFRAYQKDEAWLWEHLALTRARAVAGSASLGADVEAFRTSLLGAGRATDPVLAEVATMRARIAAAKRPESVWDPKLGPGRLQDIELVAQAGALLCEGAAPQQVAGGLQGAATAGWLTDAVAATLMDGYRLFWAVQVALQLIRGGDASEAPTGGGAALLCRVAGLEDMTALRAKLDSAAADAADLIDRHLPEVEESE